MTGRVVVLGSINHDVLLSVDGHPRPGETVLATSVQERPGGKGGNQATAAAKLGAPTVLVACVGDDAIGGAARAELTAAGVDTDFVTTVAGATGRAYVQVSSSGESSIVVVPGANAALTPEVVAGAFTRLGLMPGDVVLVSLEVPLEAAECAANLCAAAAATLVVNPAPAQALPERLVQRALLTPNEHELEVISAGPTDLLARGARAVAVTRGSAGCSLWTGLGRRDVPALDVVAVDTTGAGDTFNGALAARLVGIGQPDEDALRDAVAFAAIAASLSVQRVGARDGQPTQTQVVAALDRP